MLQTAFGRNKIWGLGLTGYVLPRGTNGSNRKGVIPTIFGYRSCLKGLGCSRVPCFGPARKLNPIPGQPSYCHGNLIPSR